MQHLYFIRHGESVLNSQGIFSGRTDTPLTPTGRQQIAKTGQTLKDKNINLIVTSPMKRTIETAQIIANIINYPKDSIVINNLFSERNYGPYEGTKYIPNIGDLEGIEKIEDLILRAKKGLNFLNTLNAENILLVSHGATGRAIGYCIKPTIPFTQKNSIKNGEIIKLF